MSDFHSQHSNKLEWLRNNLSRVDCVILPQRKLDTFIAWCKDTDAVSLSDYHTDTDSNSSPPFTIYTDDQHTRGRCEFNLIVCEHTDGELYESYGIATQINSPIHSVADASDSERVGALDFRTHDDTFADWMMGVSDPAES